MASDSTSVSQSTSTSGLPGLAQLAEGLMQDQYSWGQTQFAQNSQLTDQVVGDLMNLYGSMSGIGNSLMGMYQSAFVPEYQNLVTDANNYSSQARIQQAMGAAESGVAQNFNGQRDAALADLQSFGIDPSSGRYAQLDAAERMQEAAAAAGAGFQAEQATEATGRGLRSEALQLGSVMPSQATAAYNAASGAATAGENAKLANTQEGVNAMGSPVQWGGLASALKNSQSTSASRSQGQNQSKQPQSSKSTNQPNSDGQSYNPSPVSPDALMGPNTAAMGNGGGGQGAAPNSAIMSAQGAPGGSTITEPGQTPPWNPGATPTPDYEDPGLGAATDPGQAMFTDETPWDPGSSGSGTDNGVLPSGSGLENMGTQNPGTSNPNPWPDNTDDTTFSAGPTLNTDQDTGTNTGDTGDDGISQSNASNPDNDPNDNASAADNPAPPVPTSNDDTDSGSGDTAGGGDDSGGGGDDSGGGGDDSFAKGGEVGGHAGAIPYHMSPSHGRVTDDVRAKLNDTGEDLRLNAGEFVMPRHAVNWYGEKHFQDLIRKSKEARAKAGAKPSMKPALPSRGAIPTRNDDHGYHG